MPNHQRIASSCLVALGVLSVAVISVLVYFYYVHLPMGEFATYGEMERSGQYPGWNLDFMPRTATEIKEAHDSDSNEQWLTFKATPAEIHVFVRYMQRTAPLRPRIVHWRVYWWPDALDPTTAPVDFGRFDFFVTSNGEYSYAVDSASGTVFGWRRGS